METNPVLVELLNERMGWLRTPTYLRPDHNRALGVDVLMDTPAR